MSYIKIPEGMLTAALDGLGIEIIQARRQYVEDAIYAALRWQSDNPPVPRPDDFKALNLTPEGQQIAINSSIYWVGRMYDAPAPKLGVEDVLNLMIYNIDKVEVDPTPFGVHPSRVPALREQAKQYVRDAIKTYRKEAGIKV